MPYLRINLNNPNTYRPAVTEEQLVDMLRARDRRGVELLYDMYSAALYGVVLRVVKSREVAEDVMHDAFIKIWRSFDGYDASKGKLFTWLVAVARNLALDTVRSQSYKTSRQNRDDQEIVSLIDATDSVSLHPEHIGLKEFIAELKPEQRQIIDLIYFEGYTQSEVAGELGIPLGTVKTRLRAAVIILKSMFAT